jgi:3-hydroxybutyryl-CoA dehydrogenase
MQIVVLASDVQKEELLGGHATSDIIWVSDEMEFLNYPDADAFIDFEYINTTERNAFLTRLLPALVIIDSVADTLQETHASFVRINAWATFLSSPIIEAACRNDEMKKNVEEVFASLNKTIEWLPDEPGFVTPRVVSMMVNEAFIALGERVSTKEEMNTAMKLGTAYPYGPFEWAEKIGLQNIVTLLQKLSAIHARYKPAELMVQETNKAI